MPHLDRRLFLGFGIGTFFARPLFAMSNEKQFDEAVNILGSATASGQVRAAVIYARLGKTIFQRAFGEAKSVDSSFLLGSISKPIAIASLMALYDQGKFDLDDSAKKYIPEFQGSGKDRVTIRHLLTHVSGLPDQLPENAALRKSHAPFSAFVSGTIGVPLHFEPGTQYEYSSMAIVLAMEIAQRISGVEFKELVDKTVLQPLGMQHSAFGMGRLSPENAMPCQVEFGAVEAGGGSPDSRDWDWNSAYWRELGAPWGGAQASAPDVALFLEELLHPTGKIFRPDVAKLMIRNHNPEGIASRGLGLDVGMNDVITNCSVKTFGHTGSTGTIAWADPERDRVCVVLTTLPAGSMRDHPRLLVSNSIASIVE